MLSGVVLAGTLAACGTSSATAGHGGISVWVDSARTAAAQEYAKAHPDAHITVRTIPKTAGYVQTQIPLAQRAGNAPAVVYPNDTADVAALAQKPLDYAADITSLIPPTVKDDFAPGALAPCTFSGHIYCLRNDIGQTVLWYNSKLMQKFGYQVPSTWVQYQALGAQVAKEHPGYVLGTIAGKQNAQTFFDSSGCPTREVNGLTSVKIDTSAISCTRVAQLLQPMIDNGSLSALDQADPAYQALGNKDKILMMPGASWYGDYLFKSTYKTPAGELAAAPLPTWPGESTPGTSSVGGGVFVMNRQLTGKERTAAYDFISWMTTNIKHQEGEPTYPAYSPAAAEWCKKKQADSFYAADPCAAMQSAAKALRSTQGSITFITDWDNDYTATIVTAARDKKSLSDALTQWGVELKAAAKNAGYTVTG
jgi:multiple sugar transport system substrate-binding protein